MSQKPGASSFFRRLFYIQLFEHFHDSIKNRRFDSVILRTANTSRFDLDRSYRAMVNYESGRVGAGGFLLPHLVGGSDGWYAQRGLTFPKEKFSNLLINIRRFESVQDHRQGREVPFRWYLITLSTLFE